ncbi:Ti-type conjugative transfer relaxase TraA [Agrobacterium larrymoorei]|uniref:Ti-type conjugative transfer relaxase TraA n=1 Tax=Agrobacterium larrymoorei TaxID=160699 RepID=A0A4D7DWF1_9HYPH|nr:Ti-type conjugative transfer relaxase TraA [Agrobacterium larrymoorei]QCJ00679.1 Ti-type conjugative transfer relaxase TraA [Agrobacterium larrymoorei]QYA10680.1 Ti-type conjugative transfer relaxase TraA [Agrobacterium larrymoorei]
MAVPHFSVSIVARGSGRSAVLSAAYRHCAKMDYEREARTIDYTRKQGLLHEEIAIPADAPEWLQSMIADRSVSGASEALWNKVEEFEKRSDAQLAKDITIALPIELSAEQNVELVRDFVASHITAHGMVADWVFHDAPGNPHIHLMTTLRPLADDGFGPKKVAVTGPDGQSLRNDSGKIVYELWAGGLENFNAFRDGWFACQNRHLTLAGLDIRVDGRSFEKQGIDLKPTIHLGVGTKAIERKAEGGEESAALERLELQEERRAENARRIQRNPEIVLDLITREKSVFDERDVAKILHRYIDDAGLFQSLKARILQSPETLRLERERVDFATGTLTSAKYTTRELIRLEAEMAKRAIWLSHRSSHSVRKAVIEATFARHDRLSDEQKTAIEHVAGDAGIAAVIGRAGAGKTTMMKAAREVWEAAGYRVVGAALAGKAAEGLEKEGGIVSRTLSSWELRWEKERDHLDDETVFVIDEAGMVSSRQLAFFVEAVAKAGAKLVLIGDPDQLQPIEAGAAFRAMTDRVGYAELETIYRQKDQWMRDASLDLARGNVSLALNAYEQAGLVQTGWTRQDAIVGLIESWNRDYDPDKTTLILAHRRRDVRELNELARGRLVERCIVGEGFAFNTQDGPRRFAAGDQIVFLKNEGSLGVKNGMLAKVLDAAPGRIVAEIGDGENRTQVIVEQRFYANIDHGYATTIHKSQGATVDRVKVLASSTLDRHLIYVAMTRHREAAELHVGVEEFTSRRGGRLVDHGVAPYEHKPGSRDSYFVTLEHSDGQQSTIWGVDLKRAIEEARPDIGDRIGLKHDGSETVTLPDGTTAERNTWRIIHVADLAIERLKERLARDGSKETTLDYEGASSYRAALRFAGARGLHLMNVARTISKDRLAWTVRQKQKLVNLAARLAAFGAKLGFATSTANTFPNAAKETKPMVAGITTFPRSIEQAVEDKLAADPALKKQWDEVSMRFKHVYAQPEAAFKAANVDAMLIDQAAAKKTIARIVGEPQSFGALKGKTGLLASRADKLDRDRALKNVAPLADSIRDYLRQRGEAERRNHAQELAVRRQVALEIPALSANAKSVLERVRDAIDRNDLPSGLEYALADKMVKAELEGFAKAITERFGDRTLLPLAAKDTNGEAFQRVTAGMNAAQKSEVQQAWTTMRTVQQLSAHERSVTALKQAEALRQTRSQGLTLK